MKCEFDKDVHKLYIHNSCIFSYHLFYVLSYAFQNVIATKLQPPGAYNLGSFLRVLCLLNAFNYQELCKNAGA